MPEIILHTIINAPLERCFLLSTSIDLHRDCTSQTGEEAIDGVTKGLIGSFTTKDTKSFSKYTKHRVLVIQNILPKQL